VRERIEYYFRVPSAAVFTLYLYCKALEYRFRVPTAVSRKTGIVAVHGGADARQDLKLLAAVCVDLLSKPADLIMVPLS
jgi:hypothetical protein